MLFGLGSLLMLVGTIWLVVTAIQSGETTGEKVIWGLVNFFCQPLGGIIYFVLKKKGMTPLILVIIGAIVSGAGWSMSANEIMQTMPK